MANIVGPTHVVVNTNTDYSVSPNVGVSYNWIVNSGNIINGQGTPSITVNWKQVGQGHVKVEITHQNGEIEVQIIVIDIVGG